MMILPIGKINLVSRRLLIKSGATLIEVMISIAILSIGLVLILQGFLQCLNALRSSEDNLKVSLIGENKMGEAQIQAKEDWNDFERGLNKRFKIEGLKCIWDVDVTQVNWGSGEIPESYEDLNEINASLSWTEGRRKGAIHLVTYMRSPSETKSKFGAGNL